MNDFTKEELQYIFENVTPDEGWHKYPDIAYQLIDKIQSLIDNYCEHDFKKTLDKSGMFFINVCHKCHEAKPWDM